MWVSSTRNDGAYLGDSASSTDQDEMVDARDGHLRGYCYIDQDEHGVIKLDVDYSRNTYQELV
jgi:hypothetical protein